MAHKYKCQGKRCKWTEESMLNALSTVKDENMSLKKAAKNFAVPRTTLKRKLQVLEQGREVKIIHPPGRSPVLTRDNELELVKLILDLESKLFGLTIADVRRLVFQFCERNQIVNPFNKERKIAGEDWAHGFLKHHPQLSIRKPEGTSIFRAVGFNKEKVQ